MFEPMMIAPNKNIHGVAIVEWEKFHKTQRLRNMASVNQLLKEEIHVIEKAQSMERQESSPLPFSYSRYHNLGASLSYEDAQKESEKVGRLTKKRSNSNPELMAQIEASEGRKKGLLYQLRQSARARRFSSFEHPVSKPMYETSSYEDNTSKQLDYMEKGEVLFRDKKVQQVKDENEGTFSNHSNETIQAPRSGELVSVQVKHDSASTLQESFEANVRSRYQSEPVSLTALRNSSSSSESSQEEACSPIPLHDQHYYTYHSGGNTDWRNTRALNQIWSILEQNEETNDN
eukprot:TRINITY_DN24960_c0_g1_i5.p1 TRINITY_DN24960_c0_g1~~TRINITY_DN24960_c0_g1_i5.p1  ORF type:complete len:289 (+),score=39.12 TRINITY_DN24960_c0_g1_i5:222-1088(+)